MTAPEKPPQKKDDAIKAVEEALPTAELEKRLAVTHEGLSREDAASRLKKYGYNEIPEKKVSPILKFLTYFWGPIPGMIIVAAILSGILRHWEDLAVILAMLVMNAIVGFREEYQAGNVIAELKRTLAIEARVKRGGDWITVPGGSWCRGTLSGCARAISSLRM